MSKRKMKGKPKRTYTVVVYEQKFEYVIKAQNKEEAFIIGQSEAMDSKYRRPLVRIH